MVKNSVANGATKMCVICIKPQRISKRVLWAEAGNLSKKLETM
jgi:hypothetical protein